MRYFVCFSTSLSLNVNYVLYTTNTCHSNKSGPRQSHKTFISKRYEFKTIAYDTYNDSTCTAQTCPVDGMKIGPVSGTGPYSEPLSPEPLSSEPLSSWRRPPSSWSRPRDSVSTEMATEKVTLRVCGVGFTCFDSCKNEKRGFSKKRHFLRQSAFSTSADVQEWTPKSPHPRHHAVRPRALLHL